MFYRISILVFFFFLIRTPCDIFLFACQSQLSVRFQSHLFTCQLAHKPPELVSNHVFICIYNGLQTILEKCRQQLGKCVIHRGCAEFVGALFGRTICDHPLKSLLIYCGCLFSEIPGLSLGTASILISQLGLSCFCKEKAIWKMKQQQIKHGNVRIYWDRSGGGSRHRVLTVLQIF